MSKNKRRLKITPKIIHQHSRMNEIETVIKNRLDDAMIIPVEWINEWNELVLKHQEYYKN